MRARTRRSAACSGAIPAWSAGPPTQYTPARPFPAPRAQLAERLVAATLHTLTAPPGTPVPDRPRVSPAAARARSTTTNTAPGTGPAPAEPAVPAHRRPTAPARRPSRSR
ncbi:hypothetical protein OG599_34985 (plasmid) [Streptomyces sp. NBC_01335]|uniref:hypothetical protein n=1 Tax=Streptomyces sp. NBC_01335 TaxID=2903828 RepID=UPI002E0DC581|nr:hypothetical protein OG599_34985 [Streptomyces sp. NBC_01335]